LWRESETSAYTPTALSFGMPVIVWSHDGDGLIVL
jgi:hypothetical protein